MYDSIIIGTGPGGYGAALYAARYKMSVLVIGAQEGGMAATAHSVQNYLGIEEISGQAFMQNCRRQVENLGVQVINQNVKMLQKTETGFEVLLEDGTKQLGKTLILALGTAKRKLDIKGEKEFLGRGVSYCSTCDGFFFKNKIVAVVGGSDSAVTASLHLADVATKVYLIYRGSELRSEPIWQDELNRRTNIVQILERNIVEIQGTQKVEKVLLDAEYEGSKEISLDGVFIEIGSVPMISLLSNLQIALDDSNYIIVQDDMRTNVPGVYGVGDITTASNKFKQIITAGAEGAIAATTAYRFIKTGT